MRAYRWDHTGMKIYSQLPIVGTGYIGVVHATHLEIEIRSLLSKIIRAYYPVLTTYQDMSRDESMIAEKISQHHQSVIENSAC